MLYQKANTQTHGGFEQYYYTGPEGNATIVPRLYYQDKKNWYGEARYNYEASETFSFNAGKTFSIKKKVTYTITPIAGAVLGKINGGSLGLNGGLDYKNLFFSAESQFTFSVENKKANLFFNWSELGYQLSGKLYTGLALQVTHLYKERNTWEPGLMLGFSFKEWTFPLYAFSPLGSSRYFVLGINWQWQNSKKQNSKNASSLLAETKGSFK